MLGENAMLKGKNAIITGANRGIGWEAVKKFASQGINIWACARKENSEFEERLMRLSKECDVWIKPIYFDLCNEKEVKEGIKRIAGEKASVDILINNAAIPYGALFQMTPINKLREVFEINYFMPVLIMQLVVKMMIKQRRGVIVNIASIGGIETNPGYLAYGSSKAALIWATQSIAKELAAYQIRVNAIAPGLTETEMGNYKSVEEIQQVFNRTPMKRMAKPSEVVNAMLYLVSEQSSYVTGQVLRVDGGR